jgi:rhodanese-related sulfurtransferase
LIAVSHPEHPKDRFMLSLLRRRPGRLTPAQAHQQATDGQAVLVDVRETPEWNSGHALESAKLPAGRGVQATDVAGGMNAWALEGLPVTGQSRSSGVMA